MDKTQDQAAVFVSVLKVDRCLYTKEYSIINVEDLNRFEVGTEVTQELLKQAGMLKQVKDGIKVLGQGNLTVALTVKADKFSKSAVEKIEAAGGKAEVI